MDNRNDFIVIVEFLLRWRRPIIIITVLAGLSSIIFTFPIFIHPKFKSTVIFYPTTTISVSKALISEQGPTNRDFLTVGESEEAEQLLQILQSDIIAGKIRDKYNLMKHYRIDPNSRYANTKFGKRFKSNVKSSLTEFTSIKVNVIDEDPDMAANIANDVVEIIDTIRNDILKERSKKGLWIVENDYKEKEKKVQELIDTINSISKMGVLKYEQQSDALTLSYGQAIQKGDPQKVKQIEEKMQLVAKYGPLQEMLNNELEYETEQLVLLRNKLKEVKIDADNFIPHKFIVERAYKAERKTYPKRMLIALIATVSGFLFSCLLFVFVENLKDVKIVKSR
jgi:uncharacterized protein involved in exopolysaccharide biosynthesis